MDKEQFLKNISKHWSEQKVRIAKIFLYNPDMPTWEVAKEEAYSYIPFASGTEIDKKKRSLYPIVSEIKAMVLEALYGNFETEINKFEETGEILIRKELREIFINILNKRNITYKEPILIQMYKFKNK